MLISEVLRVFRVFRARPKSHLGMKTAPFLFYRGFEGSLNLQQKGSKGRVSGGSGFRLRLRNLSRFIRLNRIV